MREVVLVSDDRKAAASQGPCWLFCDSPDPISLSHFCPNLKLISAFTLVCTNTHYVIADMGQINSSWCWWLSRVFSRWLTTSQSTKFAAFWGYPPPRIPRNLQSVGQCGVSGGPCRHKCDKTHLWNNRKPFHWFVIYCSLLFIVLPFLVTGAKPQQHHGFSFGKCDEIRPPREPPRESAL